MGRIRHGWELTKLYRFASDGEVASGFTQADLESAVRTRGATATSTV